LICYCNFKIFELSYIFKAFISCLYNFFLHSSGDT
jgi:hypothetical protein